MSTPNHCDEATVDAVARSLHRHYEYRRRGPWPNTWTAYDDLDAGSRNEYCTRAVEVIVAIQDNDTVEEAADDLASLWCNHGPARVMFAVFAYHRINETLSDVPHLKETK